MRDTATTTRTTTRTTAKDPVPTDAAAPGDAHQAAEALLEDELLVEEISIDGMCGVY